MAQINHDVVEKSRLISIDFEFKVFITLDLGASSEITNKRWHICPLSTQYAAYGQLNCGSEH